MTINFAGIAARLLASAEALVPSWLPAGKRRGHEWVVGNLHGAEGESTSINLTTGAWADFGGNDRGGDLISLYAAIHGLSQADAAKELDTEAVRDAPITTPKKPAARDARPAVAAPVDHPPVPQLNGRDPSATWSYVGADAPGPLFIVARYDPPDADKEIRPFTWRSGEWSFTHYPAPRPLFRLPELLASAPLPVLVVEGEKAAEAGNAALGASYFVTTWSGGSQAASKTDFGVLAGRDIVIWPDADEPGRKAVAGIAGKIGADARTLAIVNVPEDMPDGWDIADAIRDGMTPEQLLAFMAQNLKVLKAPPLEEERPPDAEEYPVAGEDPEQQSVFVSWKSMSLGLNSNGLPHATIANASLIVQRHPDLEGHIWYDTFAKGIFHDFGGEPEPWTDADDVAMTVKIQGGLRLDKFNLSTVREGISHAARVLKRNSLTKWLDSLVWDGVERRNDWLETCLGVEKTVYTMAVAHNWLVSMVARAYRPGCQVDTVPVLEGLQGRGKSSFLNVLGSPWYASITSSFGGEEFLKQIQGKWLIEVPDMAGFSKAQHTHILAVVATRTDRYRDSYGRRPEDRPRGTVFAATSENQNYLKDLRGRRRWWPLMCQFIDMDALVEMRSQLFAEAVHMYRAGASWHEMPDKETDEEQTARREPDLWAEKVMWQVEDWIAGGYVDQITSSNILVRALDIQVAKQTDIEKQRIYSILTDHGYVQKVKKINGISARIWILRETNSYIARRLKDPKTQRSFP